MTPPQHICPKCGQVRNGTSFVNARNKPAKWCVFCRIEYRNRLTRLYERDKTKPKREETIDVEGVAKAEGYADHPLSTILALSHIVGAKRALAIRDGKSWRGKKAWRAYYEARGELAAMLVNAHDSGPTR